MNLSAATVDLLSSFEGPSSSNGHGDLMPPTYEDAKKIPTAGITLNVQSRHLETSKDPWRATTLSTIAVHLLFRYAVNDDNIFELVC